MLIQNKSLFCFGQDAVLLSSFAMAKNGETTLDIGTGTGIIPILMTAKTSGSRFVGLEIQATSVDLARRNVLYNDLHNKIEIVHGDIKDFKNLFKLSSFDVITTNPPYMNTGGGLTNDNEALKIARHEVSCTLRDIVTASAKLLKPNGRFYMVHRPHRLTDILHELRNHRIEPKTLRFVQSHAHKEPAMILIEAIKNAKPMLKVLPSLVVYGKDGKYSEEAYNIYYR